MPASLDLALSIGEYWTKRRLKHLILHVTGKCNFRCSHCFVDFQSSKSELSLNDFKKIAQEVGSLFWLDIGGGEPFLREDLAEIVTSFDAKVIHIPTNGWFESKILDQVRRIQDNTDAELIIGLSVDGLEATHDRIRNKSGSWQRAWECYSRLRELDGVSVKITTVLNRENYNEIHPLMDLVLEKKPDFHSIILMRGQPLNASFQLPALSELRAIGPKMFEKLEHYSYGQSKLSRKILLNFHRYLWNLSLKILEQERQVIPCMAGRCQAVVWGNGDVSACEMLESVGTIKEGGFAKVLASEAYKQQLKSIKAKQCHCTHNCALLPSIFYNPANWPNLVHQSIKS